MTRNVSGQLAAGLTRNTWLRVCVAGLGLALAGTQVAAAAELNLYSSRHYDTDERLYSDFEKATGITINRIEAKGSALIKRMQAEGANSPADVFLTTDAGRLWIADEAGLFQPIKSEKLVSAIPENLRHPDGHWFGFSTRARIIFYDKARVTDPPKTYEALADPKYKGLICARSSSNIYMLSLMAAMIEHHGADKAKEWAAGLLANFARDPQGGDTDQLRGIVSGECGIAISNTYYFARAIRKDVRGLSGETDKIGWVFPNQGGRGAHLNISGAGVLKTAPNPENAVKFLEYLASDSAQKYLAEGNDEYPVIDGVAESASVVQLGSFKADDLNLDILGKNQRQAQRIYDEVGYK